MSEHEYVLLTRWVECIRHSDGGVSELTRGSDRHAIECIRHSDGGVSELGFGHTKTEAECIRHSDGGVSELGQLSLTLVR